MGSATGFVEAAFFPNPLPFPFHLEYVSFSPTMLIRYGDDRTCTREQLNMHSMLLGAKTCGVHERQER